MDMQWTKCGGWVWVFLSLLVLGAESRSLFDAVYGLEKRPDTNCQVYDSQPVQAIFDRICDMCHEMYYHENPNLRADCRSNCFKNTHFQMCLSQFGTAVGGGLGIPPVRRANAWGFRR